MCQCFVILMMWRWHSIMLSVVSVIFETDWSCYILLACHFFVPTLWTLTQLLDLCVFFYCATLKHMFFFCSEMILMLEIQQVNVLMMCRHKMKKKMDIEIPTVLLPWFIILNCKLDFHKYLKHLGYWSNIYLLFLSASYSTT